MAMIKRGWVIKHISIRIKRKKGKFERGLAAMREKKRRSIKIS
jgi:hypothetical protein